MPRLPSRYEDLDEAFKGRLRPNSLLIAAIQRISDRPISLKMQNPSGDNAYGAIFVVLSERLR